ITADFLLPPSYPEISFFFLCGCRECGVVLPPRCALKPPAAGRPGEVSVKGAELGKLCGWVGGGGAEVSVGFPDGPSSSGVIQPTLHSVAAAWGVHPSWAQQEAARLTLANQYTVLADYSGNTSRFTEGCALS
ncbi:hypothetical protein KUCAC02_005753, partial [Chaenocephalus aceratus]